MFNLKVSISGDKEVIAQLKKSGVSLRDWSSELRTAADWLQNFFENNVFETEGGILGLRWDALNPSYETFKRKAYPGRGILERTGKMRHGWSKDVKPQHLQLWNTTDYAKYHQLGTKRMKARPIIVANDRVRKGLEDIFKAGLAEKLTKALQ